MNISQASAIINKACQAGRISREEAARRHRMIRRKGDYGNKWSWRRQAETRVTWVKDLIEES